MSLKSWIAVQVSQRLTSAARQQRQRERAERQRQAAGAPHRVDYFHDVTDPYSQLLLHFLPDFTSRYHVEVRAWPVSPPPDWAAPERQRLVDYARVDALRLANKAGITGFDPGAGRTPENPAGSTAEGDARRAALGHYLGATLHYAGEWYWGLDRLHYLETRLAALGARRAGAPDSVLFAPPVVPQAGAAPAVGQNETIHYYLSFRSPYSYIVAERAKALADAYGARLALRFVLPMVMRGLPVPRMKSRYILMDVAREARRLGVPFGRVADPLGRPVERGYALLPLALEKGVGFDYCLSFLRGVWAEGIDAGGNRGLRRIVERAGLNWQTATRALDSDDWRQTAEANRRELMELGLWGVPSFRVGEVAAWGQDRLWVIEDVLNSTG